MLNAKAFAHAATVVTAVFYVIFLLVTYVAPNAVFNISKSWFQSMNLESLKAREVIPAQTAMLGLISLCVVTWVTTYAMIWLYNKWYKYK